MQIEGNATNLLQEKGHDGIIPSVTDINLHGAGGFYQPHAVSSQYQQPSTLSTLQVHALGRLVHLSRYSLPTHQTAPLNPIQAGLHISDKPHIPYHTIHLLHLLKYPKHTPIS